MLTENYIIDKILQLCDQKDMSRYRLAQKSGVSQSSISTLLNRQSVPTIPTLEKICNGLGVTLSQFFAETDQILDLTTEQQELLEMWGNMSEHEKGLVKAYMQGIVSK